MKINFGIILLLLMQLKSTTSDLERELRISIDKAMQCDRREPPTEPVIAMSPKRFSQLVGLLRHDLDPPACDKGRRHPPFRLDDPSTWTFCVFGTCRNNKCHCFKNYFGSSCAVHSSNCWLMYCFLTSCHSSLQSFNCKCDTKLYGTKVKTDEYWYDEGKHHTYKPPPPGWKYDIEQGSKSANVPPLKEIFVPLSKPQPGRSRSSNPNQRQGFPPQHGQSQFQEGRIPTDLQQFNPNAGQIQIFEGGQPVNPFQSQQHHSHGGQIQGSVNNGQFGGSFQSQENFPNSGQNNDPNFNNGPGSLTGARGSQGSGRNSPEDTTDDIEEALEEMTEEPSPSISLFGKEYILCSIVLILNYAYQYILNI